MAGGRSLVSSMQDQEKKSEPLKMEKNGLQYPKVGNKLQTITSGARHTQHNKLLEIFFFLLSFCRAKSNFGVHSW